VPKGRDAGRCDGPVMQTSGGRGTLCERKETECGYEIYYGPGISLRGDGLLGGLLGGLERASSVLTCLVRCAPPVAGGLPSFNVSGCKTAPATAVHGG